MNETTAWFDDEKLLDVELKRALQPRTTPFEIPGYSDLVELARGGQGIVYTARQIGTRRTVAVKIMKDPPTADDRAQRRFEREVDLAAGLKHQGIVRIYDSGRVSDGRPFFVMELIDGVAIDRCDAVMALESAHGRGKRDALARVLTLFRGVVDAVHYAHRRGVIHRDIKPSNIRVDADGRPHVLDFGLAKQLVADGAEAGGQTTAGSAHFLGSLHWASPEQALGKNDELDVRTDVYALGLCLYRLVTNAMPYRIDDDWSAILARIRELPPIPPREHQPDLATDLETIILRCLAKDPDRRYQNAADLDRDLEHFLAGEPIAARRDSAWYTLRTAARRYRRALLLASLLTIVFAAALIVSIMMWRDSEKSRDIAIEESRRSDKAMKFLIDMVRAVEPDARGQDVKMADLLGEISSRVDTEFSGDERSQWLFRSTLAVVYERLADWRKCLDESRAAYAIGRRLFGEDAEETTSHRRRAAYMMFKTGDAAEAIKELESVRDVVRRKVGEHSAAYGECLMTLGRVKRDIGELDDADRLFGETKRIAESLPAVDERLLAGALDNAAAVAQFRGNFDEARRLEREAWTIFKRTRGEEDSESLTALSNLVVYAMKDGRLDEATALMENAVPIFEKKYGAVHESTLILRSNLAKLIQDSGRLDEGVAMMEKLLPVFEKSLGEESQRTMTLRSNLASAYASKRRFDDAERMQRKLLEVRRKSLGETRIETLIDQNNLANTLQSARKLDEALSLFDDLVKKASIAFGPDNESAAIFRMNHAKCLMDMGRFAEAEPILLAAKQTIEKNVRPDHPDARGVRIYLRQLYEATGRSEKASDL